jgi:IMP dehydrogenase
MLFLDTPNPDSAEVAAGVARIRRSIDADLVIGSVVTGDTAQRYIDLGVDALKVGLGAGALCSIRRSAGVGLAQATALERVREVASRHGVPVISDGGVRHAGDIVKALALGASAVMIGSMLAGCDETPGELVEIEGKPMKRVAGLRLSDFELELPTGYPAIDDYLRKRPAPRVEGRDGLVPAVGPCHLTLLMWLRSVRVGVQMSGAKDIPQLWSTAEIVRAARSEVAEAGAGAR